MDTPSCWWLRLRLYLNMSRLGFIQKCCFAALSCFALFNNQQTLWMQYLRICAKSRAIKFFAAKSQGFEFWNSAVGAVLGCRDMTGPVSSGFGTSLSASLENHWWSCVELPVLSSHRWGGHSKSSTSISSCPLPTPLSHQVTSRLPLLHLWLFSLIFLQGSSLPVPASASYCQYIHSLGTCPKPSHSLAFFPKHCTSCADPVM